MTTNQTIFTITLTPAPGHHQAPPIVRLRRLLKAALRGYGLRVVSATEHAPATNVGAAINFDGEKMLITERSRIP